MKKQRLKLVTTSINNNWLLYFMDYMIYIYTTFCKEAIIIAKKGGISLPTHPVPPKLAGLVFLDCRHTPLKHQIPGGVRLDVCSSGTPTRPDVWKVVVITRRDDIPSRELTYPTLGSSETPLQNCFGKGHVSSHKGISLAT